MLPYNIRTGENMLVFTPTASITYFNHLLLTLYSKLSAINYAKTNLFPNILNLRVTQDSYLRTSITKTLA